MSELRVQRDVEGLKERLRRISNGRGGGTLLVRRESEGDIGAFRERLLRLGWWTAELVSSGGEDSRNTVRSFRLEERMSVPDMEGFMRRLEVPQEASGAPKVKVRRGDRYRLTGLDLRYPAQQVRDQVCNAGGKVLGAISPANSVEEFNGADYGFQITKELFDILHSETFGMGLPVPLVSLMCMRDKGKTIDDLVGREDVSKATVLLGLTSPAKAYESAEEVYLVIKDSLKRRRDDAVVFALVRNVGKDGQAKPFSSCFVIVNVAPGEKPAKLLRLLHIEEWRMPEISVNNTLYTDSGCAYTSGGVYCLADCSRLFPKPGGDSVWDSCLADGDVKAEMFLFCGKLT